MKVPVPAWEGQELSQLGSQGKLHGVSPQILAVMALAESGGQGSTYTNSSGYGGYFGLSRSDMTMFGEDPGLLTQLGPKALAAQADVASSIFDRLAMLDGGNVYTAEKSYQGGSSEGDNLFRQYGIPQNLYGGGSLTGTGPGGTPAPSQQSGSSGSDPILSFLGDIGGGILDVLTFPLTAAEDAIGFGVGLVWPLILRVLMVVFFLGIAAILIWHLVGTEFVGGAKKMARVSAGNGWLDKLGLLAA